MSNPILPIIRNTHIVPENVENIRLSDYAIGIFPSVPSRKGIKKAIKKGGVLLNGRIGHTGDWVKTGDQIDLLTIDTPPKKVFPLKLEVLMEDDYLAVIYKPAGFVVSGNQYKTVRNALAFNLKPSTLPDALFYPKPVHRLDAPTTGLLLIAKTAGAAIELSRQFEQKTIRKCYQALVIGQTPVNDSIDTPIDGKEAYTSFEKLEEVPSLKSGYLTLLNLYPKTGRTHQLRRHLSEYGTPILGDGLYGQEGLILKNKGLFLSAVGLSFRHPLSGKVIGVEVETPLKFGKWMEREERRWGKYKKEV